MMNLMNVKVYKWEGLDGIVHCVVGSKALDKGSMKFKAWGRLQMTPKEFEMFKDTLILGDAGVISRQVTHGGASIHDLNHLGAD